MNLSSATATTGLQATATATGPAVTWREKIGGPASDVSLPLAITGYECSGTLGLGGDAFTLDVAAGSSSIDSNPNPASGILTLSGNAVAAETITIGSRVYTWVSTLTAANQVKIGTDAETSLDNLIAAVNGDAGAGTLYGTGTVQHELVSAQADTASTIVLNANTDGTAGNSIATTETMTAGSFGSATLTGGANASTLQGADGNDIEGDALTPLTKTMALRITCTAGGLTIGSGTALVGLPLGLNGVFEHITPAGVTTFISPDLVLTATATDTAFTVEVLGTTV